MRYTGYQENKSRGTFGFPIQLYYVDSNHPQYEMPFHWHMECELILVLDGKFHLSVNGVNYELEKGQSVFIPSEFIHGGTPETVFTNALCLIWTVSFLSHLNALKGITMRLTAECSVKWFLTAKVLQAG